MAKKTKQQPRIREVYQSLTSSGEPFYGLLSLRRAIESFGIDLDPPFQRGYVWTPAQQSLFVGHLLEGGNTNPVILNTGADGTDLHTTLVDGKQRIAACNAFADGRIAATLYDGRTMHVAKFDEIDHRNCNTKVGLRFALVRLTDAEVLEFYIRFNRGGTPHTEADVMIARAMLRKLRRTQPKKE